MLVNGRAQWAAKGEDMPFIRVNDIRLYYEEMGNGEPLVLVHGSWSDHSTWQHVVPALATSYRVVTYDRRGHSQSEQPSGRGSRREDEDDLAALMMALDCVPAHVAGDSFGASIVLGLAARRPELFRSAIAHEPPLLGTVADDAALQPVLREVQAKVQAVLAQLEAGDIPGGTQRFVEEVAVGPGAWEQIPDQLRENGMRNAPTFVDEQQDPEWAQLDLARLSRFSRPALLTHGEQSPTWYLSIIETVAQALPQAEVRTLAGVGHLPYFTNPGVYVATLTDFLGRCPPAPVDSLSVAGTR
jgi:pimeloyl-ACP methyl ester carboxylesterase